MAFDGITIASIVKELNQHLTGGRIYKIAQPEPDELLLTIKNNASQYRLLLSADASLPLVYLTGKNKQSPLTAPGFCMLLRKHLQNARILDIAQPGLERIIRIRLEHLNEMGDLCQKTLVIEIMGKHSNIIFCNENMIIDSIKHISGLVSSVREVLPGREYFIPQTQDKQNPLSFLDSLPETPSFSCRAETPDDSIHRTAKDFREKLTSMPMPLYKALYCAFTGLSPVMAQEICFRAGLDGDIPAGSQPPEAMERLYDTFLSLLAQIAAGNFAPNIIYEKKMPVEFAALPLTLYADKESVSFDSISEVLEHYYEEKSTLTRIRQKSTDLRRIVQTALERNIKKYDLQRRQMKDTEKREKYRIYGELLNTYGYGVEPGAKSMKALNYYTNEMITIPLDDTLTPSENAKKYFDKYGKLKRTFEALSELTVEVKNEIEHLESIAAALDIALQEEDLVQIREELIESGYIRRKGGNKKVKITSRPFHYISSDGFHMYVGKNNYQNDELTFKLAVGSDWWFHAKGMPGSHVIVKTEGKELPDRTFEEAARLAAWYSKGREQEKVEIDYLQKKNVKKPNGSKPGFVVYYTNFSMAIDSDISGLKQIL
ncbi:MAG: fibronectin/fibrinogen-binding protein [Lachnospiraceae bacterium]|nr:fibronectin/fibrinogen-binding protein [Lachnospiraceae bacterium]